MQAKIKIIKLTRKKNSYLGNPTWDIVGVADGGEYLQGKTASNALIGYEISWTWEGQEKTFDFHYTKTGNLIFDRLAE